LKFLELAGSTNDLPEQVEPERERATEAAEGEPATYSARFKRSVVTPIRAISPAL